MSPMTETDPGRAARQFTIEQARANSALEGQRSSDQARADQDAYVRGEITIDELIRRAKVEGLR